MTGGAFHGLVEGLAGGGEDGEDGKGQSKPNVKGLLCRGPAKKSWRWGQSWVWRLQAETQQMGLALKRGHLWGGTEAERVTVSGFLYCIAIL